MSEKIKIDDKIMELFHKLLDLTPNSIEDRVFHYNINGEDITLTWFTKRESDRGGSMCPVYYNADPFKRSECSSRWKAIDFWAIETSPELEGYTFCIDTSACQFKITDLSRRELIEIQEKIEAHYTNFIPNFLQKLLDAADWD